MTNRLATASKEVLVEVVKLSQKRGMKGSKGGWKEFLNSYDRKFGASLSDPARRSADALLAFLNTFAEENFKFFDKVIQCHSNRELVEQLKKESPDDETPEQRLVRLTLGHPLYPLDYSFPSYEEGWVVTRIKKKSKALRSNEMVAVDCEMVLCEDGTDALVKICVVDRNFQVMLDELVNPNKPVADYRTEITGLTAKDLDGVTCSLENIQKSVKKLLSHGTILIGHSLNSDLRALKLDHARVIDTSLIFKYLDGPTHRRPSLYDLCMSVLGYEVRKKGDHHNCLNDACATMKLALAKIERGIDVVPLIQVPLVETAKLLFHGISTSVPIKELYGSISGNFTIERQPNKKAGGDKYSVLAVFKSPDEACEAFENLKGNPEKDSFGRPQKFVSFTLSTGEIGSLYVRKMVHDNSHAQDVSKKRASEIGELFYESKKSKMNQKVEDKEMVAESKRNDDRDEEIRRLMRRCDDYAKEMGELKKVLGERDHEISVLHKIISNLTRKQGL